MNILDIGYPEFTLLLASVNPTFKQATVYVV